MENLEIEHSPTNKKYEELDFKDYIDKHLVVEKYVHLKQRYHQRHTNI